MQIERLQDLEIFSRREATSLGVSGRSLTELVRTGSIVRVGHRVYRAGPAAHDPRGVSRAMKVSISHDSAAAWYGASLPFPPDKLHVTGPRNRKPRSGRVTLHRSDLRRSEVTIVRGVSVTTPVRTVLDIARTKPLTESVAIADSMCRLGFCSVAEIESAAHSLPRGPGRPAAAQMASFIDPLAESVFESMTRVDLAIAGLAPASQLNIHDRGGTWIARVDFAWPEHRVVLECDGFEFHGNREAFERDRRRWSALTSAGWRVVVVTWRDVVGDPTYLVGLIADLLMHTSTHN